MERRLLLTSLFLSGFLGVAIGSASGSTDPTEPPPHAAYLGYISKHHLAGETGTSLYRTAHGWRLAKLSHYVIDDPHYWQYEANSPYHGRWAFKRYPDCWGCYSVYVRIRVSGGTDPPHWVWRRVEGACRIRADPP